jgi:DNA helicase-2/ATP-dependent DNA helicase PcrA
VFLKDLNKAQYEAVVNTEGPSLIIAGAGSGKTRVLIYRIAYLLSKGIKPGNIIALTFTNRAANEMKGRIDKIAGSDIARYIWMGTFHSIFARILRYESDVLGYTSNYSIYDNIDSKSLIKSIIRELELDEKVYKPGEILNRISSAKNNLITAQAYFNNSEINEYDKITRRPRIADIYRIYNIRCKKSNAMDFDDLLLNTNILFRDFPDILKKYQEKFQYILVDEYQDTNYSQHLIVNKLAAVRQNVCVVGDDSQSIYSFRGAKIENILDFRNIYTGFKLFKLEQNYRSTKVIVDAANSIIIKNKDQIHKKVWSDNETGEKIKVIKTLTDTEEGFYVSNSILDTALREQERYSEFAVLYRTNAQSRIFEESLRKRNIPYKIYGSISFYERKEIKDALAYLRLTVNHEDNEALKRIINYPARGIGKTTLGKLENFANDEEKSIWQIILQLEEENPGFNKGTLEKLKSFANIILDFDAKKDTLDAYELSQYILSSTGMLKDLYNGKSPEEISKYENIQELLNGIREFVEENAEEEESDTLYSYLQNVSLLTNMDNEKDEDKNKVTIMTIHSAKGLEFNHVYIAGVEEDLLPSRLSLDSQKDIEEERRLLYVAVTRARKRIIITYAQSRYKWGLPTECTPSRFLNDIKEEYIDRAKEDNIPEINRTFIAADNDHLLIGSKRYSKLKNTGKMTPDVKAKESGLQFAYDNPEDIQAGMKVEHQRFGIGKIIHIEGNSPNRKATVFFQDLKQEKQLLLKFAKLKIINKYDNNFD